VLSNSDLDVGDKSQEVAGVGDGAGFWEDSARNLEGEGEFAPWHGGSKPSAASSRRGREGMIPFEG